VVSEPTWILSIAPKRMTCNLNCLGKTPTSRMEMKRHSYLQLTVKNINNGENSREGLDPLQLALAREQREELQFGF